MKKLNSDQPISSPMFSQGTFFILLFTLVSLFLLPNFFIQEGIDFHFFLISITSFLLVTFYLSFIYRQRQLVIGSTPVFWPLISIFLFFSLSFFTKRPFPSLFHFLSYTGVFLNFVIISLIGNTLIKKNNNLIVINALISFASGATILAIFNLLTKLFPQFLSFLSFLPQFSFSLQFSLILLGLTAIFALFFKKGKLNHKSYFFILPLLFLGLVITILQSSLFPTINQGVLDFQSNLQTIFASLINTHRFDFFHFFFGQPQQTFADFYRQFSATNVSSFNTPLHSCSLPLLIQAQFGFFATCAWLFFFFRLFHLAFFSSNKKYNYLFFILFISCCIQLFAPFSPLILIIQAFIIAFASDKNQQRLINLNFSATNVNLNQDNYNRTKKFASSKKNQFLIYAIIFFFSILNFGHFFYVSKSYFSYFIVSQTLANPGLSLTDFIQKITFAQKVSPSLDYFNRLAAIAKLEETIALIKSDPQQEKLTQERALAQESLALIKRALTLNPFSALNYETKATIYQELEPYNANSAQLFKQEIISAYSQAILLQPRNPDLYLELANFYLSNSQTEIALNLTQEALKTKTNYLPAIYQLGQIYQLQNQTLLARDAYQQAKDLLDPQSSNYNNNLQLIEQKLSQLTDINSR